MRLIKKKAVPLPAVPVAISSTQKSRLSRISLSDLPFCFAARSVTTGLSHQAVNAEKRHAGGGAQLHDLILGRRTH